MKVPKNSFRIASLNHYMQSINGSMSKTLKFEAKTPKKKLLKKTMTKTPKSNFFYEKLFFYLFIRIFVRIFFVNTASN